MFVFETGSLNDYWRFRSDPAYIALSREMEDLCDLNDTRFDYIINDRWDNLP
jgi:hypothetical protein